MGSSLADKEWYFEYTARNQVNWTTLNNINHTEIGVAIKTISAVTCSLSIMGSLAIILSYVLIKDIRSKARELLVHLSIMDLTFTTANFIGILLPYDKYLFHHLSGREHDNYERVCKAQAFFAVYGTIGSILWSLGLAVYLYYRVVSRDPRVVKRVVMLLYVVCYLLPLHPSLWLLLRGHFGYPASAVESGGWCTVLIGKDKKEQGRVDQELMLFMVDDIWIWLTFITMVPVYLIIHCRIRAEVKECGYQHLLSSGEKRLTLLRADQKFLLVPIGFIGLRVWDVLTIIMFAYSQPSQSDAIHYRALVYLDAIGDNGQGFLNFVFFCVLQARVRQYTRDQICRCLCCKKHHTYSNEDYKNDIINDDSFTASGTGTTSQLSNYSSDPPRDWIED